MNADDCCNYELILNTSLDIFLSNYNELMKLKPKTNNDNIRITKKLNFLNLLVPDIHKKFDKVFEAMNNCVKDHNFQLKELEEKKKKFNLLIERYKNQEKKMYLEGYHKIEEEKETNKEKEIINKFELKKEDNSIKDNKIEKNNLNYNYLTEEEELEEQKNSIIQVQKYLEKPESISGIKKEDLKEIIKIKNQLQSLLNEIEVELNKNDEQLLDIENNIENTYDNIEKGNKELKEAANHSVHRRATKYKLILGTSLGVLSYIIPGLNIVTGIGGAIIGYGIGKGMEKIDKFNINKNSEIGKK